MHLDIRGIQANIYAKNHDKYKKALAEDYLIDKTPEVLSIESGCILPIKLIEGKYRGGVCAADGSFVAGHLRKKDDPDYGLISVCQAYDFYADIPLIDETVVYGGFIYGHFGHFIVECLSRIWWYLENRGLDYKFIFISPEYNYYPKVPFIDFLYMLGLREDQIIYLNEPTRFSRIIIPEQTTLIMNGYMPKAALIFDAIRDSAPSPAPNSRYNIYLTRRRFKNAKEDCVGEEYFERFYSALGYDIISPEQLSIPEQVSILANAKKIVCINGTLHHLALFSRSGVEVTVLNRINLMPMPVNWINQLKSIKFTCIDIYAGFLPLGNRQTYLCRLLLPTKYWRRYIKDTFGIIEDPEPAICLAVMKYLRLWAQNFTSEDFLKEIGIYSLADLCIHMNEHLLDIELDESTQKRLRDIFTPDTPELPYLHDISPAETEKLGRILHAFENSRWIKLGRRLGFLKEAFMK